MQDASGLLYKRNRYYSPETGQFTQTDPIGLAGGLNTYGFAEGDPVSYDDPYGLKVDFENTLSLNVGQQNSTVFSFGGAKTYMPLGGWFNDNARTIIDVDYGRHRFGLGLTVSLAHELGHAWAIMSDARDKVSPSLLTENSARILHGCAPSRYSDEQLPPPCR
jgi:uncharacterized protein RhaS with RHS repeats